MKISEVGISRFQMFLVGFFIVIGTMVLFLRVVIGPLFLALFVTYILAPFLNKFNGRGIKNTTLAWITVLIAIFVFIFAAWIVVPLLFAQISELKHQLPYFQEYINTNLGPLLEKYLPIFPEMSGKDHKLFEFWDWVKAFLMPNSDALVTNITRSTHVVFSIFFTIFLTPFFVFFLIENRIVFVSKLRSFVPRDLWKEIFPLLEDVDKILRDVLRGQILLITFLSLLYGSSFALLGMPFGFAVGFITGLARIVPYMDIVIGGSLSFLVLVTNPQDSSTTFGVIGCFFSIQLFDLFFLTPKVFGKYSGLHPFIIILSVLCFGDWFGFFGVLLAIPCAAVGRVIIHLLIEVYKGSTFYKFAQIPKEQLSQTNEEPSLLEKKEAY